MPRKRITAVELARLLNSADRPIYVLDDELTIVFVNRACCDWIGPAADELVGLRAAYHSDPEISGPEAVAARLCPPPESMTAARSTANVSCVGRRGQLHYRRARFVPIGPAPDETIGLIAVLDVEDLPEPVEETTTTLESDSVQLHERIARFRRETAGRYRADRLLGDSPAIRKARRQIEVAAGSRESVLLVGPTGSGRRHTAAAIHYSRDPSKVGSLIPLACAVLGADLIHSTVRALRTGDVLGKEAERSTLLLNEVDRLQPDAQANLAGELVGRSFPLRLIATAERSPAELASRGEFLEDLAAVLSTITIELPPLAERIEDLPLLSQQFLEECNARGPNQIAGFTQEALDAMHAYRWQGNLDELTETVAEAHRQTRGPKIDVDDLPERIHLAADAAAHPPREQETIVLDQFLEKVERELIRRALAQAKGNKSQAARLLGISRARVIRRVRQLGLEE